jgi:outer membrane protein assembly factor BamB
MAVTARAVVFTLLLGGAFTAGWFGHAARLRSIERAWERARVSPTVPPRRAVARTAGERPLDAPPSPAPVRMFRGDRDHTGRSGYALPPRLTIVREVVTGGRISTQPVLSSDAKLVVGSHDGVLYAIDPDSAEVAWRLNTGDRIYTTPLVAPDGTLYAGTDADRLFSVNERGRLLWALGTDSDADTSPARAEDGTLRFAAGRVLYRASAELSVQWRLQLGAKVFSSPLVLEDGTTVVGCQDDKVYAVDASGAVRWSAETGGDVDATPAHYDGVVYVGSDDGHVYALSARDGRRRWRTRVGGYVRAGVAVGLDGNLVVGTFGPTPRIVALARDTGALVWSVAVTGGPPTAEWGVASAALVDRDGRYAIGLPNGQLWVLERNGTVLERVTLRGPVDGSPVLVRDGLVAVGDDTGALFLLGPPPGPMRPSTPSSASNVLHDSGA